MSKTERWYYFLLIIIPVIGLFIANTVGLLIALIIDGFLFVNLQRKKEVIESTEIKPHAEQPSPKRQKSYRPDGYSIFIGIAIILGIYFIPLFSGMTLEEGQKYCHSSIMAYASCSPIIPGMFYGAWLVGIGLIIYGALRRE